MNNLVAIKRNHLNVVLPHVVVDYDGISWCVAGSYSAADESVGYPSDYQAEVIWMQCDTEAVDMIDLLRPIVVSGMEDEALLVYEKTKRGEHEYALEKVAQGQRDEFVWDFAVA